MKFKYALIKKKYLMRRMTKFHKNTRLLKIVEKRNMGQKYGTVTG